MQTRGRELQTVVLRAEDKILGRQGESLMMNVRLADWIASDPDDYVRLAIAKSEPRALAALRAGLRERLRASPLMDAARFATHFEAALRGMWTKWCNRQQR